MDTLPGELIHKIAEYLDYREMLQWCQGYPPASRILQAKIIWHGIFDDVANDAEKYMKYMAKEDFPKSGEVLTQMIIHAPKYIIEYAQRTNKKLLKLRCCKRIIAEGSRESVEILLRYSKPIPWSKLIWILVKYPDTKDSLYGVWCTFDFDITAKILSDINDPSIIDFCDKYICNLECLYYFLKECCKYRNLVEHFTAKADRHPGTWFYNFWVNVVSVNLNDETIPNIVSCAGYPPIREAIAYFLASPEDSDLERISQDNLDLLQSVVEI